MWLEVFPRGTLMQLVDATSIYQLVQMSLDGLSSDGCSCRLIDPSSGQVARWFTFSAFPFSYLGSGTFSLFFFFFFSPDVKCQPSVDISPNTHFSACNLHHLQCSWVWPLGAEAEHEYTVLKMADWRMAPLWHSRLNLNFMLVACLWKIFHLVPSPFESARCHKNQHLRIQKKRDRNTSAWEDTSSSVPQHRRQRAKTKTLSCLCLLSRSCWASISAIASCEALTLGASGLAPSQGESRRAIWWLRRQSERREGASHCLLSLFCHFAVLKMCFGYGFVFSWYLHVSCVQPLLAIREAMRSFIGCN